MDKIASSIKVYKNTGWKLIQSGVTGLSELITMFVVAHWLELETYGALSLGISVIGGFQLFATFGIGHSTTKFIAEYKSKNEQKVNYFVLSGMFLNIMLGVIFGVLCFISSGYLSAMFSSDLQNILRIGALLLFFENLRTIFESIFRGFQSFKPPAIASVIARPLQVAIVSLAIFFGFGVTGAIVGMVCARIIASIFLFKKLDKHFFKNQKTLLHPDFRESFKSTAKYSLPIGIYILVYYLYSKVDVIFLGYFTNNKEVAYYSFANLFIFFPFLVLNAFGMAIGPLIAGEYAKRNKNRIQIIFEEATTISLFFTIFVTLAIFIISGPVIEHFFPKYKPSITLIQILCLYLPLVSLSAICDTGFLIPSGNASLLWKIISVGASLNIIADLLLIPKYGAYGAVLSTVIVRILVIPVMVYLTIQRLNLKFKIRAEYIFNAPKVMLQEVKRSFW